MNRGANVSSISALRDARAAIDLFIREAVGALAEADSELARTWGWLEREAVPRWQREIRQRQLEVERARSELARMQLIAAPNTPTALAERKAFDRAKQALEEAQQKAQATRRMLIVWEREAALYKGQVSALGDSLMHDLPAAQARIERAAQVLDEYANLSPLEPNAASTSGPSDAATTEVAPDASLFEPLGDTGPTADIPDAFAALRRRTPPGPLRSTAALTDPVYVATAPESIGAGDLEVLHRLALPLRSLDREQYVTLRSGALASPTYYLERLTPTAPSDSGWFIGSSGGLEGSELQALPVWALLTKRPDLRPWLELPEGTLIAIAQGRVQALLDSTNTDLWMH